MHTFTVLTPASLVLPPELALLLAPVRASEPSHPDHYLGRAEGVVLDEEGRIVAFVVRLSPRLAAGSPRTLVTPRAVTVTDDGILHLSWTADQLLAQPRLNDDASAPKQEAEDVPDSSGLVPPGDGVSGKEVLKEAIEGSAGGAVLGTIAGLALAGPIGALALGGFFAVGGVVGGLIAGASHEPSADETKTASDDIAPDHAHVHHAALHELEETLRDTSLGAWLHTMRFTPTPAPKDSREDGTYAPSR